VRRKADVVLWILRGEDLDSLGRELRVTLADGGECIAGLATLRQQPDLFGQVASTPTAGRVLEAIEEPLRERLRAARAEARAGVWRGEGG
jgi:hypothetical protein